MITLRENRCFESLGIHIKAKINIPEIGRFENFYDLDENFDEYNYIFVFIL